MEVAHHALLTPSASNPDDLEQTTSQQCGKWHRNPLCKGMENESRWKNGCQIMKHFRLVGVDWPEQ